MRQESDDNGARCSTQAAIGTGDIATLGRAYYHLAPGWGVDSVGRIGWEDDDDGATVDVRKFIGLAQCVRAEIDAEPVQVRVTHAGSIAHGLRGIPDHRLVGVSPTAFALVGADQLGEHVGIDVVTLTGQITSLIMAPEAAGLDGGNEGEEFRPWDATLAFGNFAEMP